MKKLLNLKKLGINLSHNPLIPLLGIYLEKTIIQKGTGTPVFIAALFTVARTWKQHSCPSTGGQRSCGTYTQWSITQPYKGRLFFFLRKTFDSVLIRWMNLEPILQSEVSQKEESKYHILMHIYGIQKNEIDELVCREGMEMQIQSMGLWTQQGKESMG